MRDAGPLSEAALARRRRVGGSVVGGIVLAAIVVAIVHGPVPQDPAFHGFADARAWLGVPNAANVLSNAPILLVGIVALAAAAGRRARAPRDSTWAAAAFATYGVGLLATAVGSAAYHLAPTDATLVWDRLPMAVVGAALVALVVGERLGARAGRATFLPLLLASVAGVLAWRASLATSPGGDLRAYAVLSKVVPFAALVVLPLAVPEPRASRPALWAILLLYVIATALEALDAAVLHRTGGAVAGHAAKHVVAAAATYALVAWRARSPLASAAGAWPGARASP